MTTAQAAARRAKIILCVDDQIENTMALQAVLEGEGYGFRSASSGAECLNLVNQLLEVNAKIQTSFFILSNPEILLKPLQERKTLCPKNPKNSTKLFK